MAHATPPESEKLPASTEYTVGPTIDPPMSVDAKPASLTWAYRLLWITFGIFFASTGAGKLWDRYWHATVRFDTFWSPPHFFVFIMTTITGGLVVTIACTPNLRKWFGPTIHMPLLPFEIAGSLVVLGTALGALCITITLDSFWHTAYGLDETQWSVPHCMLGWCWLTIILGFVAARVAFHTYYPLNWITRLVMALLIVEFLCPAILGPFYLMYSPDLVHALANIPIVRTEPSAQHLYRIYLHFGLTRQTHFLFIPIVSLFVGAAIALLRRIDTRARIFLLVPFLWSISLMARDIYTLYFLDYDGARKLGQLLTILSQKPSLWIPIPLLIAALAYTLFKCTALHEPWIMGLTGILFGVCTFIIWHSSIWMILLALPAGLTTILGGWIGNHMYDIIERPTVDTLIRFLLSTCAQIPAALGIIDLFMRRITP